MYRKCLFYCLLTVLWAVLPVNAQLNRGEVPPSFKYASSLKTSLVAEKIPVNFSMEDLKITDEWQAGQGAPLRVAKIIEKEIDLKEVAVPLTLPGGENIRQFRLQAQGAIALMLYYKSFSIPEGGKLFIYNADKTQVLGAYDHTTNPLNKEYATEFVAGDDLVLEYVDGDDRKDPSIIIHGIGYGYNHLSVKYDLETRASGTCMVDINCEEGDAWQVEKRGVTRMIMKIGNSTYYCTGSLINNTAEDLKPYILSAYHCMDNGIAIASESNMNEWLFYFNYETENCNYLPSVDFPPLVGCSKIAYSPLNGGSDGLLLLLNQDIPENYNVYFNGWDIRDAIPQFGVNIHHPSGDLKKISTFTEPPIEYTWEDVSTKGVPYAHLDVLFSITKNGFGVTEGGSSGSPLFNEYKLITGTLTGGSSSCFIPNGSNVYGKLSYHWDYNTARDKRMDVWLDPGNTKVKFLQGRYLNDVASPRNLSLSYGNNEVKLSWNEPAGDEKPVSYNIYVNHSYLDNVKTLSYTDTYPTPGNRVYGVSAIYENDDESSHLIDFIEIEEYKSPTDISVTKLDYETVKVEWKEPESQQTFYWGNQRHEYNLSLNSSTPFYFGQLWEKEEVEPLYLRTLKAVQFIPVIGNYEIFIRQGNRSYSQKINSLNYSVLNTIPLNTPFVIGSEDLIVSVYSYNFGNSSTAATDHGPMVDGKGNVYSRDGNNWGLVYISASNDEGVNFIVSAIVSSEKSQLPATTNTLRNIHIDSSNTFSVGELQKSNDDPDILSLKTVNIKSFNDPDGYNVYRDNIQVNSSLVRETQYEDTNIPEGKYVYSVSAVYGREESYENEKSREISVSTELTGNQDIYIYPTIFEDQVTLVNPHLAKAVDVYSVDGKLIHHVSSPVEILSTGHFQSGIYFFRIHTEKGIVMVKGIKK